MYDLAILGGGPAGLAAAIYAVRKMLKTCLVSGDIGGQILLTSDVANYLGFELVSAPDLVQKYAVMGTPKIVINETVSFDGALPEPLFIAHLLHAQEHLLEKGGEPVGTA